MKIEIRHIFSMFVAVMILAGCKTIHEFPGGDPANPTPVTLDMRFEINDEMLPFNDDPSHLQYTVNADSGPYDLRYTIEVHDMASKNTLVERKVLTTVRESTDGLIVYEESFAVKASRYRIAVWVDQVPAGTDDDLFYAIDRTVVKINGIYCGSTDYKDAFAGTCDIDLTPYENAKSIVRHHQTLELIRPLAKIQIITTDVDKYVRNVMQKALPVSSPVSNFTVKFSYSGYMPTAYKITESLIVDAVQNLSFLSTVEEISESASRLGYDYVFVNGNSSTVMVDMTLYDSQGVEVKSISGIAIPVQIGRLTTISDNFLTRETGSGIGIDTGFEGTITYPVPEL